MADTATTPETSTTSSTGRIALLVLGDAISFLLFAVQAPWLIYLVNGAVDGGLGILVLAMYRRVRAGESREGD